MLSAPSGSAQSERARCPGPRGVSTSLVWVGSECHHPLSGAAHSVCRPLSGSTWKTFLNQSPFKRYTKVKGSNVVRVDAMQWPPVVRVDAECHHPLSVVKQSVAPHCPGRRGNLIGQLGVSCKIQNLLSN